LEPKYKDRALRIVRDEEGRGYWAYDYPHSHSPTEPIKKLKENLNGLPEEDQLKVMGQNAVGLYNLQ